MDDKLMYISNEDNHYCIYCRLHLLLEKLGKKFKQSHLKSVVCTAIHQGCVKQLGGKKGVAGNLNSNLLFAM